MNTNNNSVINFASIALDAALIPDAEYKGNNSEIFTQEYEERDVVPVIGEFEINGMRIEHREQSILLNAQAKGEALRFFTKTKGGAALAAAAAIHTNRYERMEVGAHFYSTKKGSSIIRDKVGVVTYMYEGNDPEILRLKPESGVNIIGLEFGAYKVTRRIPVMTEEHHADESRAYTEMRQTFFKHVMLDVLLKGKKILASVQFYAGDRTRQPERTKAYLAKFAESFAATPEVARGMYQDAVLRVNNKRHEAAIATSIKQGRITVDEDLFFAQPIKIGENTLIVKDLLGRKVNKFSGGVKLNNAPITLNATNIKAMLAMVVRGRQHLELIEG